MADYSREVADLVRLGRKREAIKLFRQETGVGLQEAKQTIDILSMEPEEDPAEEPVETPALTVTPEAFVLAQKGLKAEAIQLLHEQTGLDLKEARRRVEQIEGVKRSGCLGRLFVFSLLMLLVLLGQKWLWS